MKKLRYTLTMCGILLILENCYSCANKAEEISESTVVTTENIIHELSTTEKITETEATTEKIIETEATTEKITETEATTEKIIETEATTEKITETETTTEQITETEQVITQIQGKRIDVKCILQNPELPSGCEVTSLAIVLKFYGIDADKCYLSDKYLKKGKAGSVDIYEAFIGDPRDPYSYGCYAPPLVECANAYLNDIESTLRAHDTSYTEFDDLLVYIDRNIPVIIWNTEDVKESSVGKEWTVNGKSVVWLRGQHCLVMTGYDKESNFVYVADPMKGNVKYPLDVFARRYEEMMMQAVIVY